MSCGRSTAHAHAKARGLRLRGVSRSVQFRRSDEPGRSSRAVCPLRRKNYDKRALNQWSGDDLLRKRIKRGQPGGVRCVRGGGGIDARLLVVAVLVGLAGGGRRRVDRAVARADDDGHAGCNAVWVGHPAHGHQSTQKQGGEKKSRRQSLALIDESAPAHERALCGRRTTASSGRLVAARG